MKQSIKSIILFIALLLPVVIFLFLKLFGDNKFDIPLYYNHQDEIALETICLNTNIIAPYVVDLENAHILNDILLGTLNDEKITLLAYSNGEKKSNLSYKLKRLQERLEQDYQMILFVDSSQNRTLINQIVVNKPKDEIVSFWKCTLLTNDYYQWVLLDNEKRIRGYYDSSEEEMDRLIVEMAILIKNNNE